MNPVPHTCCSLLKPIAACLLLLCNTPGHAAPGDATAAGQLAEDFLAVRETSRVPATLSLSEGRSFQSAFVKALVPKVGKRVGYKVGLVSREAQERFHTDSPVRGVLLETMILEDGAVLPPRFAVRPLLEADLVVVVKDRGINKASSVFDVAEHLKEVAAFIELPDNFLPTNPPPTAARLVAVNVGARAGVLGQRMPVEPTQRFIQSLASMVVTVTDSTGAELGRAQGSTILDQPLNAVLWLIEDLQRSGESLKAGDLISLGTIKTVPYPAGKSVTVRYVGLPRGPIQVSAHLP
jgi:2-keto-4-pentenoate hydratase